MKIGWLRRLTRFVVYIGIAAILGIILFELGLRLAFTSYLNNAPDWKTTQRLSGQMPQYKHSPYWSPEFVLSMSMLTRNAVMNDDMQWVIKDMAVPGYTFHNDERLTTDQPGYYTRTIWLFGSSSVQGQYVADGWTIASYLQREFNLRGIPWRVRNLGHTGAGVVLEYYWLRQSNIKSGDIVIFIDGGVDLNAALTKARNTWISSFISCQLGQRLQVLLLGSLCQADTAGVTPRSFVEAQVKVDFVRYWRFLAMSHVYTNRRGATFLHYMQPLPLGADSTVYTQLGRDAPLLVVNAEDYFDDLHYDDDGHAKIARQIADSLIW